MTQTIDYRQPAILTRFRTRNGANPEGTALDGPISITMTLAEAVDRACVDGATRAGFVSIEDGKKKVETLEDAITLSREPGFPKTSF
jgi:hypothetical protein